jgi:hypothetical protein
MPDESSVDFFFVGAFSPREIKRVTHHLEALDIDYEVEFDDSEITEMSPATAAYGGLSSGVTIKLYVDPAKMLEVESVMEVLYPR